MARRKKDRPINPGKMAKLMLLDIFFKKTRIGTEFYIARRGQKGEEYLRYGQGSSELNGTIVYKRTMKRAVQAALQSMDKTRFYWK